MGRSAASARLAIADEPTVFDRQHGCQRAALTANPANESLPDIAIRPKIVLLIANPHMGPGPKNAVVMVMVFGKVVGDHLAARTPDRMNRTASTPARIVLGNPPVGDLCVVVSEYGVIALREAKRSVTRFFKMKGAGPSQPASENGACLWR